MTTSISITYEEFFFLKNWRKDKIKSGHIVLLIVSLEHLWPLMFKHISWNKLYIPSTNGFNKLSNKPTNLSGFPPKSRNKTMVNQSHFSAVDKSMFDCVNFNRFMRFSFTSPLPVNTWRSLPYLKEQAQFKNWYH